MSAFTRTQLDATWTTVTSGGYLMPRGDVRDLDSKIYRSINGDKGGAWAPSSPIQITSAFGSGCVHIVGPTVVRGAGYLKTVSGARWFPNGQWPKLGATHTGRSRRIVTSCARGQGAPRYSMRARIADVVGLQAVCNTLLMDISIGYGITGPLEAVRSRFPLRTHHGATLTQVTVRYAPKAGDPKMRVVRVGADGTKTPLTSSSLGADAGGYIQTVTPPATAAPITVIAVTIPIDGGASPSNAIVDRIGSTYFLEIVEDQSIKDYPHTLIVKQPVKYATTTNLSLVNNIAVDGMSTTGGDRVLVRAQTDPAANGIYIVNASGAWGYAPDAGVGGTQAEGAEYVKGMIVGVQFGNTLAGSFWQLQDDVPLLGPSPQTYATIPTDPTVASGAFLASGNIYYSATVDHVGIVDQTWQ